MAHSDFNHEEDLMFAQREAVKPILQGLGLSNSPTALAILGMSLAKSLGYPPLIGSVAGAALGGVILALAGQAQPSVRPPFRK